MLTKKVGIQSSEHSDFSKNKGLFFLHPLLTSIILSICLPIFLKFDSILLIGNIMYQNQINSISIYVTIFLLRFSLGLFFLFISQRIIFSLKDSKNCFNTPNSKIGSRIVVGIASGSLYLLIAWVIIKILGGTTQKLDFLLQTPDIYVEPDVTGWAFFLLALIPAIFEEVVFRGYIIQLLQTKFRNFKVIFWSTSCFALYHIPMLLGSSLDHLIGGFILSLFFGVVWSYLAIETNSIIPSGIAHYIVDSLGILFLYAIFADMIVSTQFMVIMAVSYPVVHIGIIFLFKYLKNRGKTDNHE